MRQARVIKLLLPITTDIVLPTIRAYTDAFNFVCEHGWQNNITNKFNLQKQVYSTLRQTLPAQLSISVLSKASEALKSAKTMPNSKGTAIRYDARSYTLKLNENKVSLLLLDGRHKVNFNIPEYFKRYLAWKHTSADLFIRDNQVFLHIVMQQEVKETQPNSGIIGIDRGIKSPAVLSNNKFFGGKHFNHIRRKYTKLRSKLQKKGTRTAKRHLHVVKHKEKRFIAFVCHKITKTIVSSFKSGTTFVLEKLTNIRDRCRWRKPQRTQLHKWPFYQFQFCLTYKAISAGMSVEYIDPAYTSQTCSKCGYCSKNNRRQSSFRCQECGFRLHADLNGSRNIRDKHLNTIRALGRGELVTCPIGSGKIHLPKPQSAGRPPVLRWSGLPCG